MRVTLALSAVAAGIGALHTLAPDHWLPFAALARAEHWSNRRAALVTAACGVGHVSMSVLLGLVSLFFGLELIEAFGRRLESVAGALLVAFGLVYGLWGLHRAIRAQIHEHVHDYLPEHQHQERDAAHLRHHDHSHHPRHHNHGPVEPGKRTAWTLFLLFSADPCVAVVPLIFGAAPLGWASILLVVVAYEVATIGTMVCLALPARAAANTLRGAWADRYGDALAGGAIATVGVIVAALGI